MDKFAPRGRGQAWQTRVPVWPFVLGAFVIVSVCALVVSPFVGGDINGDGTARTRLVGIATVFGSILFAGVFIGGAAGLVLNAAILNPGGRQGGLKWAALLVLTALVFASPVALIRGLISDRTAYDQRLYLAFSESQQARRRAESDLFRRLDLLNYGGRMRPAAIRGVEGEAEARRALANRLELVVAARRDYDAGEAEARAALSAAVADPTDREAVLDRFDASAAERRPLMVSIWNSVDRETALITAYVDLLTRNRAGWEPIGNDTRFSDPVMFRRAEALGSDLDAVHREIVSIYTGVNALDARTDEGIERVLAAAN